VCRNLPLHGRGEIRHVQAGPRRMRYMDVRHVRVGCVGEVQPTEKAEEAGFRSGW